MGIRYLRTMILVTFGLIAVTPCTAKQSNRSPGTASQVTVTMTARGIQVKPSKPQPGSVLITVFNKTNLRRGLVVYSKDTSGAEVFRHSPLIRPGNGLKMNSYFFAGRSYYFKDYTSTSVQGNRRRFTSHYKEVVQIPGVAARYGRGIAQEPVKSSIVLTNGGIQVAAVPVGASKFVVTNNSDKARGIVLSGKDRTGTPILRYTRQIQPGKSTAMNVWLYDGRTYSISDYTACTVVPGKGMEFTSEYSQTISVPEKTAEAKL